MKLTLKQLEAIMMLPKFHGQIEVNQCDDDFFIDLVVCDKKINMYHYSECLQLVSINKKFSLGIEESPGEIEFYDEKKESK